MYQLPLIGVDELLAANNSGALVVLPLFSIIWGEVDKFKLHLIGHTTHHVQRNLVGTAHTYRKQDIHTLKIQLGTVYTLSSALMRLASNGTWCQVLSALHAL